MTISYNEGNLFSPTPIVPFACCIFIILQHIFQIPNLLRSVEGM
jgi:hypothetical protein